MDGHNSPIFTAGTAERLHQYLQVDQERSSFMNNMIKRIESDAEHIKRLELDLANEKHSRTFHQSKCLDLEKDLASLGQRLNKNPFVVVLVDGDGAKFADALLCDPRRGAEQAAHNIKEVVRHDLRSQAPDLQDVPILVRVFANLNDLARCLRASGVTASESDMLAFAEHFTNSCAHFDFINVGRGKENADSKIRRNLSHYHNSVGCKKIYVAGCCHDKTYLHDLREYKGLGDDELILVETTPSEPGFSDLGFPITRFDNVFRSAPLNKEMRRVAQTTQSQTSQPPKLPPLVTEAPSRPSPASQSALQGIRPPGGRAKTPPPATVTSPSVSPSCNVTQTPERPHRIPSVVTSGNGGTSINYANVGGSSDAPGNINIKTSKPKKVIKTIICNADAARLDPPTQHPPRTPAQASYHAKFQAIKPFVFCNDHYLKGRCRWGDKCDKTHDVDLTPSELAIHRYKARTSMCPQGPNCDDYDCFLSHHCFRTPCTRDSCHFSNTAVFGDLHYTDAQMEPKTIWTEGFNFPEAIKG